MWPLSARGQAISEKELQRPSRREGRSAPEWTYRRKCELQPQNGTVDPLARRLEVDPLFYQGKILDY